MYSAPLRDRERDPHERDPRRGAHAVGDRGREPVAVADTAEVGEQQFGNGVVTALERGGEPEPFLVLREQRTPERAAAEAVTLVGDEQPARTCPEVAACTRRPSAASR